MTVRVKKKINRPPRACALLRADLSADFVAQDAVPGLLDEWLIPPHARGWTQR